MALYIKDLKSFLPNSDAYNAYQAIDQMFRAGRLDDAIAEAEKFLKTYPDYASAHNNLGVMYYDKGENEKALGHYEKAVELAPENTIFLKNLADFYYGEQLRSEDAMKIYLKLLKTNPEDVDTFLIVGNIAAFWGQLDHAKIFYNRVLEIEPWNLTAMDNLDYLKRCEAKGPESKA